LNLIGKMYVSNSLLTVLRNQSVKRRGEWQIRHTSKSRKYRPVIPVQPGITVLSETRKLHNATTNVSKEIILKAIIRPLNIKNVCGKPFIPIIAWQGSQNRSSKLTPKRDLNEHTKESCRSRVISHTR